MSWDIAELAPNSAAVVSFEVTLSDAVANGAGHFEPSGDQLRGCAYSVRRSVDGRRVPTQLELLYARSHSWWSRSAPSLIFAQPRDTIVYDIIIRNEGTDVAERVRVDGQLPKRAVSEHCGGGWRRRGGALSWRFDSVPEAGRIEVGQSVALRPGAFESYR